MAHSHQHEQPCSPPPAQHTSPSPAPAPADNPTSTTTPQANPPTTSSQTFDQHGQPDPLLLRDKVRSLSHDWLAGMRADVLEIQELMHINERISQDFVAWVEAGAVDSLVRQQNTLRASLTDIHLLETQAAAERDRMDLAIAEMKKITDRLIDPSCSHPNPPNNL